MNVFSPILYHFTRIPQELVLTRSVQTLKADAKPKKIPKGSASNAVRRDNILLNDHSRDHLGKKAYVDLPARFSQRLAKVFER